MRGNMMIVEATVEAPKTIQEALELAERTGGALQVPPSALCLHVAGGEIALEGTWPNDSE